MPMASFGFITTPFARTSTTTMGVLITNLRLILQEVIMLEDFKGNNTHGDQCPLVFIGDIYLMEQLGIYEVEQIRKMC